jgi:hypothetical protein
MCALFLVGLVIVLCAPGRSSHPADASALPDTPLTVAVVAALAVPSSSLASAAPAVTQMIHELTARLVDGRPRAALPRSLDLGAIRAATTGDQHPARRTADILAERRNSGASALTAGRPVTGAAVALGSPKAGERGGVGSPNLSTAGSSGAPAAVLGRLSVLPLHAGFTVARHTTRTGTVHASIRPLVRPG